MGWSIGYDGNWGRDIGYGVPAYCDHPKCEEKIDRGLSNVCSDSAPYGGDGCGLYFCEKHHAYYKRIRNGFCYRCKQSKPPYKPKPDHPEWIAWKRKDASWADWRRTDEGKEFMKSTK